MKNLFRDAWNEHWALGILVLLVWLALTFALDCLLALFVMLLWNAIIPVLFVGVGNLWYWGALGLVVLCGLLFKTKISINDNKD
jgi:hypothetical protein